jgi:hypothetical protein
MKEFLGISIKSDLDKQEVTISQSGYVRKILEKFGKNDIKLRNTPLLQNFKMTKNEGIATPAKIREFQQEIGSLIHLIVFTRCDMTFPVNTLARVMSNPSEDHFAALDWLWGYLSKTRDFALNYETSQHGLLHLVGYVDSDWGSDLITRKSTSGYIIGFTHAQNRNPKKTYSETQSQYTNKGPLAPISWLSKLQKTPAISSCEAEYMAYKEVVKEKLFLNNLIEEIGFLNLIENNKILYTDSQSAIELSKNPVYHARTKHVDITYHFTRYYIVEKQIDLQYISTKEMLADNLTKIIGGRQWYDFIKSINMDKSEK